MNLDAAHALADAVLLEGYALYPYRASAPKNRYRWAFGVLAPREWSEAGGCEAWWLEAQLLVAGTPSRIAAQLRCFQIERRRVVDHAGRAVAFLESGGQQVAAWDEGVLRTVDFAIDPAARRDVVLAFGARRNVEQVEAGRIIRECVAVVGRIEVRTAVAGADLTRITIRAENLTPWQDLDAPREQAIVAAIASTHLVVGVEGGALISLLDPPAWARDAAAACTNTGTYPVLVGPRGASDVMMAAPFILYDHPEIAPESVGDLCDATEIDEILTLRTMTMTDDEKREARATDARAAAIVDRVETLPDEWLERMHGAARALDGGEMVPIAAFSPGTKVRLKPARRGTDVQDLVYAGHVGTVAGIRHDVDGSVFLALTIDDDPAAELHAWYGRFHYYRIDEVERL